MADLFSKLAISLGLKKTEAEKLNMQIAESEDRIRTLNDKLNGHIREIEQLSRKAEELKQKYLSSAGTVRRMYESQLRSLLKELEDTREMRDLLLRNLERDKLMLRKQRLLRENMEHQVDPDSVDDLMDDVENMGDDLVEEDDVLSELEEKVYAPPSAASKTPEISAESSEKYDEELLRQLNAELGLAESEPEAPAEEEKNNEVTE